MTPSLSLPLTFFLPYSSSFHPSPSPKQDLTSLLSLSLSLPYFLSGSSLPDAQPTEAETAVWNQVSAVLEEAHGILAELQSYNGAGQEIREVSTTTPLGRAISSQKLT